MDKANISLFNDDGNKVAMPSINKELDQNDKELVSESIDNAILNEQVKTLLLPETEEISPINYIFDFSEVESATFMQMLTIKGLKSKDGDVSIYLYNKSRALYFIGYGEKYKLERTLPLIKQFVFEDKIRIFKNFERGKEVNLVEGMDITQMRLNL